MTRNRWKIMKSSLYTKNITVDFTPTSDPDAYFSRWASAIDRFFSFVNENLPNTKVLLHSARNVTERIDADGTIALHGPTAELLAMNAWWDRLDAYVNETHPVRVIDIYTPELKTFHDHPWGPFAVHYTLDYHAKFLSVLTRFVVIDARSDSATTSSQAKESRSIVRRLMSRR